MKKETPLHQKLEELLKKEDFAILEGYKDPHHWKSMTSNEREVLAFLFVKQGERQLRESDKHSFDSFELAEKAAPESCEVFIRIGNALSQYKENMRCLTAACRAYEHAIRFNPESYESWCNWGVSLMHLAILQQDPHYCQEAQNKFKEAERFLTPENKEPEPFLYVNWGVTCFYQGRLSGEALDYRQALDKFSIALQTGYREANYFNFYGDAISDLAFLINRKELLFEAAELYRKAVELDSTLEEKSVSYLNLGACYERIFDQYGKREYYEQADKSLSFAVEIDPENGDAWNKWASLYATAGKIFRDIPLLQASLEKFERADQFDPHNPQILSRWGDALVLCGSNNDRVDLIRSGEEKIKQSLEIDPESTRLWYLFGSCSNELGRYFNDETFYNQAIDKFQYGLSLNQSDPLLWYGLALAHFSIGELIHDVTMVEKSARYCSRALEFGGQIIPQFWNDWGVALMKLAEMKDDKSYVEASIEKFEQAIHRHGESGDLEVDPEWLYNYGCALDFMGDFTEDPTYYEKAVQVLAKVLQIDSHYVNARYNLAVALSHLGEMLDDVDCLQKSIEQFNSLLNQDREDEMACNDLGLAHLHLAELLRDPVHPEESQKHYEQSEARFAQAVALGNIQAYYNLACLNSLLGNYEISMHYMERADASGGLPDIEDLMHDEWLEGLRETEAFKKFLEEITNND